MPSPDPHIPLTALWQLARRTAALNPSEQEHLADCERCIGMLGICRVGKSFEHAQQMINEQLEEIDES